MLINRKFGDYLLLQRLAVGGQSEVFLAYKMGPGEFLRPVVIKALPSKHHDDERHLKLFFKEAFISSRFAHPNVITVYDAKLIDGEYCLIMDFVAGQTVSDIAQRGFTGGKPLSLNHSIQIIADACDGLHYAHNFRDLDDSSYRIVHCDISPQNIMVTYQGVTKVFDFGIAHIPGYEDANSPITVGGKFAYMSPEQLRGEEVDARSDIFSLGIILYELSTGYRLFRRKSQPEVIRAICEEPIRPPTQLRSDLPIFLERCILKALERDPDKRYPNAVAMRDDLLQLLAMMSRGSERDELGRYVEHLFTAERDEIASILRQGADLDISTLAPPSNPLIDLNAINDESTLEEQTMELEAPEALRAAVLQNTDNPMQALAEINDTILAQREAERRAKLLASERDAARADLEGLVSQVASMRARQNLLMVALVVLVLGALGLTFVLMTSK